MAAYVPAQWDLVVLSLDPQAGHEPTGRRPGIVVSVNHSNRGTLEAAKGLRSINEIAADHKLAPPRVTTWKKGKRSMNPVSILRGWHE